jgi:nucleotide-binding universal stress UspA family protein
MYKQQGVQQAEVNWFPACAGMTSLEIGKSIRDRSSNARPENFASFWHRPCNDSEWSRQWLACVPSTRSSRSRAMITLKKILVPTDFSEHSAKAVLYGAELAKKFGAELHLMHAVEMTPLMYGEGAYVTPETDAEIEAFAAKQLEKLVVDSGDNLKVVRKIQHGHPFVETVRYAKENDIGLIVIGTHGRGAIAHMLLGSVAEKVVRKAPCPVLVVRDEEHEFVMP